MVSLAIAILWLTVGIVVLGCVIWIALNAIRRFFPGMDPNVDYAVWSVFAILILIYVLTAIQGGSLATPHLLR